MSESPSPKRLFELFVDSLEAERDIAGDELILHLGFFGEDIAKTAERLKKNPRLAVDLVHQLSSTMQDLDSKAGGVDALTDELGSARRWALVLPENEADEIDVAPKRKSS